MDCEEKTWDVFISYSSKDRIIAEGVCGYLEGHQTKCFIDYRDIPKGLDWPQVIPSAIRSSRMMVTIFSKNYNLSKQTDSEITIADKHDIPILSFRIANEEFEGTKEYFLLKKNWLDAFPEPEKQFGKLLTCIQLLLKHKVDIPQVQKISIEGDNPAIAEAEVTLRKGIILFNGDEGGTRDMIKAAYLFQKAAKAGVPDAEYRLGMAYWYAHGIPHSWTDARYWLEKASEKGHPKAMRQLAIMHHYSIGTPFNSMKALELYTAAADKGDGIATKLLGRVYHNGNLGVIDEHASEKYYEQAYERLYEESLDKNDTDSQCELGKSYRDGEGVTQNYQQAIEWYNRAASNNSDLAYLCLGFTYEAGLGVEKNAIKSFQYNMKAALMDDRMAQSNIGYDYFYGFGCEKNIKESIEWRLKAANGGNVLAQTALGDYYLEIGEDGKDLVLALRWYKRAIESGSFRAMHALGIHYLNHIFNEDNEEQKGFLLLKRAAIMGHCPSFYDLAQCYQKGIGTPQNNTEAQRWYQRINELHECKKETRESTIIYPIGAGSVACDLIDEKWKHIFDDTSKQLMLLQYKQDTDT